MKNVNRNFALACSVLFLLALPTIAVAQTVPGFTVTTFATDIVGARDASTDNAGNVYTTERDQGGVFKISPTGVLNTVAILPTLAFGYVGYFEPVSGNVFVSRHAFGAGTTVLKVTPAGVVTVFASGIPSPAGLTSDATGNLYVSSFLAAGKVFKITPSGVVSVFATGLNLPDGLAFGPGGDLFIGNRGTNQIMRVPAGGGTATVFASGFTNPIDVAGDSLGKFFVANFNIGTISKVSPTGTVSPFGIGFFAPVGLAFDPSGNLFVAEFTANRISKIAGVSPPAAALDHFKCYEAEGDDVVVTVDLEDQFGVELQVLVGEPKLFCNPVDKNGEGISNPTVHLTCYEIEDKEGEERVVEVDNQFGVQTLKVEEPELLCVPSEKISVAPEDDDEDDDKDDDDDDKDKDKDDSDSD